MAKETATYQQLQVVIREEGCPICRLGLAAVGVYLDTMLWESSTDLNVHAMVTASLGFCGRHSRELLTYGGQRLGAAVLERAALLAAQQQLPALVAAAAESAPQRVPFWARPGPVAQGTVERWSLPEGVQPCPACVRQAEEERRGVDELLAHLDELAPALLAAGGLCLPHLLMAARVAKEAQRQRLLAIEQQAWAALGEELESFISQHKSHRHGEPISERARAALERTITSLTGEYPVR